MSDMELESRVNEIAKLHGFTLRYLRADGKLVAQERDAFCAFCKQFRAEIDMTHANMGLFLNCSRRTILEALKG
jgi:hypothetical protein